MKFELNGLASIDWEVDVNRATPTKYVKVIVALPVVGGQWRHVEVDSEYKVVSRHGESVSDIVIKVKYIKNDIITTE